MRIFGLLLLLPFLLNAQIEGTVVDNQEIGIPFVNIYLENTYVGTTSNENGHFILDISEAGTYTVVFQSLGYHTQKVTLNITDFPYSLDVLMKAATYSLDEVVISATEDPAYRIIRNTIAQRKANLERISEFTADFYSRGIWRVDSVPKKILGQDVGDFDGALDSTRTGIIYLSETISKIAYRKPNDFKETIVASKVSGNDNGFSFNSAQEANFSFYENSISLNASLVSPIANNALNYYRYTLEGVFYEGTKLINKIKVVPKRSNDRVWSGTLYIVEDDWQLYGLELKTTGTAIQIPFVKDLVFKQNFTFDKNEEAWVKISQTIDFSFGFLGFNGDGRFIAVYSNYNFDPGFTKSSFSNEVLYFEPEANKKDSLYWEEQRPVSLTNEEQNDYVRKDSIQELRKSEKYLDSVDAVANKFSLLGILTGQSYKNSYDKWELNYEGPLPDVSFNTVQGWNGDAGVSFFKWYDDYRTQWISARVMASYGISEDRLRWTGTLTKSFNRTNRLQLTAYGGSETRQFNNSEPISPLMNSISSLFFERNYMKLYELNYGGVAWSQELFNGLRTSLSLSYQDRKPLYNTTDYVIYPDDERNYTSNNPLLPNDYSTPAFERHQLIKSIFSATINFGQKYMTYPDGKFNIGNDEYPELRIEMENAFGASETRLNYTQLKAQLRQNIDVGNLGEFRYRLKGGGFIAGDGISFVDYQHFNGNQTRVGSSSYYTNVFNLLPYYSLSTNKSYFEGHAEHHFNGWLSNKIPVFNWLNYNFVIGGHALMTTDNTPYQEVSVGLDNIGWGKYRFLRIDYVHSYFGNQSKGAFIFGLKFLNMFD